MFKHKRMILQDCKKEHRNIEKYLTGFDGQVKGFQIRVNRMQRDLTSESNSNKSQEKINRE